MKTFNITNTINRNYPVLKDLLTEKEFYEHLTEKGLMLSATALRDYRFRDIKFAYIHKGQQVFYPIHVNKEIIKELKKDA